MIASWGIGAFALAAYDERWVPWSELENAAWPGARLRADDPRRTLRDALERPGVWVHGILVEKVTPDDVPTPRCIAGTRACPPEDCGATWGYAELVQALADDGHERHAELARWVPPGWIPERFDLALADRLVAKHGVRRARIKKQPARTWVRARARASS